MGFIYTKNKIGRQIDIGRQIVSLQFPQDKSRYQLRYKKIWIQINSPLKKHIPYTSAPDIQTPYQSYFQRASIETSPGYFRPPSGDGHWVHWHKGRVCRHPRRHLSLLYCIMLALTSGWQPSGCWQGIRSLPLHGVESTLLDTAIYRHVSTSMNSWWAGHINYTM